MQPVQPAMPPAPPVTFPVSPGSAGAPLACVAGSTGASAMAGGAGGGPGDRMPPACASLPLWRLAQGVMLLAGVALVGVLLGFPSVGLDLFWNALIPLAPALIVVAPGVWRNICPMATFSRLLARFRHLEGRPVTDALAARLALAGLVALLVVVPLRHVLLNTSAVATAFMLLLAAALALYLGTTRRGYSGWCNGLCPIHPVERLYGQAAGWTPDNARCDACHRCSRPCPDSTRALTPLVTPPVPLARLLGHGLTGGFAGFVVGWYQVPDYHGAPALADIATAYAWPGAGALVSLLAYAAAYRRYGHSAANRSRLARLFATAAVAAYYWYRIPALAGFGPHPGTGMLVDLSAVWPALPWLTRPLTTAFFVWFLLLRPARNVSWLTRPALAPGVGATP